MFLTYLIHEQDPNWDGTYIEEINNSSDTLYPLALVEFNGHTFRFGIANDEVFSGLPLWDKGLVSYAAHIIKNSKWMEELKTIHKVHPYYNEKRWDELQHFALLFHDEIFEVIAKEFKIECFKTTFKQLAIEVANRMNA